MARAPDEHLSFCHVKHKDHAIIPEIPQGRLYGSNCHLVLTIFPGLFSHTILPLIQGVSAVTEAKSSFLPASSAPPSWRQFAQSTCGIFLTCSRIIVSSLYNQRFSVQYISLTQSYRVFHQVGFVSVVINSIYHLLFYTLADK